MKSYPHALMFVVPLFLAAPWPGAAEKPNIPGQPAQLTPDQRYQELLGGPVFRGRGAPQTLEEGIAALSAHYGVLIVPGEAADNGQGQRIRPYRFFAPAGDRHRLVMNANTEAEAELRDVLLHLDQGLRMAAERPLPEYENDAGFYVEGGPDVLRSVPAGYYYDEGARALMTPNGPVPFGMGRMTLRRGPRGHELEFQPMRDQGGLQRDGEFQVWGFENGTLVRRRDV
ncbi:MAG: hypothetical protein HY078_01575 [Elusimicrobia bacterium]|nr:hypothetical protein [Elusimicrobiota bacterium]